MRAIVAASLPGARWFAAQLERGAWGKERIPRGLSALWASAANPVRPLALPRAARVIGIGGATLGGSGKSRVTLELARVLARRGMRVAVVASAYPARDRTPRRVRPDDAVGRAGDEALWLARGLATEKVGVFVGAPRQAAVAMAAESARIVIVDGLLQARPERLALSLLALDGSAPWGSERCPPVGDLRAGRGRLLQACDAVLLATDPALATGAAPIQFHGKTTFSWSSELRGAWTAAGRFVSLESLRGLRLGLLLSVARPERIRSALSARGVAVCSIALYADHQIPKPPPRSQVDAWLTTAKCATKVVSLSGSAPIWSLDHQALLPDPLLRHIGAALCLKDVP